MSAVFVLGRAGAGKTHHCLDAITQALAAPAAETPRRLILLAPEQATFQLERALVERSPRGGFCEAEVLSFSRLAQRVLAEDRAAPELLNHRAADLLLRAVGMRNPTRLKAFGGAIRTQGFYAQLGQTVRALLREGTSPQEIAGASRNVEDAALAARLAALAQIYAEFVSAVGDRRCVGDEMLARLRARLANWPPLRAARVWVDGFAGFTGQELETLVALGAGAAELTITLLMDPKAAVVRNPLAQPTELGLFSKTEQTYARLYRRFQDEGVQVGAPVLLQTAEAPRFEQREELLALEASLAGAPRRAAAGQRTDSATSVVRIVRCESPRDELRAAAQDIRRAVVAGKAHYRDFAVIARSLDRYAFDAVEVFRDHEIPYFIDRRRSIAAHSLVRASAAVSDIVRRDYPIEPVSALLRSELVPIERDARELLENFALRRGVSGRAAWWNARFGLADGSFPTVVEQAREALAHGLEPLDELVGNERVAARDWARALAEAATRLDWARAVSRWADAAEREEDWETAGVHHGAWENWCTVLEEIHDVLGDELLSVHEFAALLVGALREETVGLTPPRLDQVLLTAIDRSRHPELPNAIVVGMNEGVFPAPVGADVLFSGRERGRLSQLGLNALRPAEEDAFVEPLLFYIAATRPAESLMLTYAEVGAEGAALAPSRFVKWVRAALPTVAEASFAELAQPVCLAEAGLAYLGAAKTRATAADFWPRWRALDINMCAGAADRRWRRLLRGLAYQPQAHDVRSHVRRGADGAWEASASELVDFVACPYRHFAKYGLALEGERGPRAEAVDLGSRAHEILAATFGGSAADEFDKLTDEDWLKRLAAAEAAVDERAERELPAPRQQASRLALGRFLRELVSVHVTRYRAGRTRPFVVEQVFGEPGGWPAMVAHAEDGVAARLHGKIDRVDVCEHDGAKTLFVYDYKSSGARSIAPWLSGETLQLASYAAAAEAWLRTQLDDEASRVGGMWLAPLFPKEDNRNDVDELDRLHKMYLPRGKFARSAAEMLDQGLGAGQQSRVVNLGRNKDGAFSARGDVVADPDLAAISETARAMLASAAAEVRRGKISVAPLLENKTLACKHCPYKAVCRFEVSLQGRDVRDAQATLPRWRGAGA